MSESDELSKYERLTLMVEIWKKTVEVQQHFNDIELRIRNIAVTVLVAGVGASAFSIKEALQVTLFGVDVLAGRLLLFFVLCAWLAFYGMDRYWYHRLLMGAVNSGANIENLNKDEFPELNLTSEIGAASPVKLFKMKIHSTRKMDIFYGGFALILVVTLCGLGMPGGDSPS